ncbi:thiol-activated cytolysin family protein [Myroides odoratimimus]|uniref:thiol-activated cytolysin family protein n=1 Tax=Myroides odoratimimus TaxID=76832 RepID=UPI00046A65C1|nr:thiol-activated cytolysin family protein [Myroides odoratimimus]
MDINPISSIKVKGVTNTEPIMVSSVTYGRMGVLTIETDSNSSFAKSVIEKTLRKVFKKTTESYTKEELAFYESSEFKTLIIGGNGQSEKSINGLPAFISHITETTFDEYSYGGPISCKFVYANTLEEVQVPYTIKNTIKPLYVSIRKEKLHNIQSENGSFDYSNNVYMDFYRDRSKSISVFPSPSMNFYVEWFSSESKQSPFGYTSSKDDGIIIFRNENQKLNSFFLGTDYSVYQISGTMSGNLDSDYSIYRKDKAYSLVKSPFFISL